MLLTRPAFALGRRPGLLLPSCPPLAARPPAAQLHTPFLPTPGPQLISTETGKPRLQTQDGLEFIFLKSDFLTALPSAENTARRKGRTQRRLTQFFHFQFEAKELNCYNLAHTKTAANTRSDLCDSASRSYSNGD